MIDIHWSRREKVMLSALIVVGILFISSFFWNKKTVDPIDAALKRVENAGGSTEMTSDSAKKDEPQRAAYWIDVKGAVHKPGIYQLKPNTRVFEAIREAGGTINNADTNQINLAQPLTDGMVVYIPKKGEEANPLSPQNVSSSTSGVSGKVNINTASEQELVMLPGVGPAKAQAIIQYRNDHGKFASIQDLKKISGLGEKTIDRFKDQITAN